MAKRRSKKKTKPETRIGALATDSLQVEPVVEITKPVPTVIRLESRRKKRNIFLSDNYRNELDAAILNKEIGKREHKGKIKTITTIKHVDVTAEGDWLTEFIIEMKG